MPRKAGTVRIEGVQRRPDWNLVTARVIVAGDPLDLPTPPTPVRIHAQTRNNRAILQVRAEALADEVRPWAEKLAPDRLIHRDDGDACNLWLHYRPIPDKMAKVLSRFDLRQVLLDPDGSAEISMLGTRSDIQDLVRGLPGKDAEVLSIIQTDRQGRVEELTARQEEAVRTALDAGYYEVPRGVSLTDLAGRLELSPSSLSELLRRAERAILKDHLASGLQG